MVSVRFAVDVVGPRDNYSDSFSPETGSTTDGRRGDGEFQERGKFSVFLTSIRDPPGPV